MQLTRYLAEDADGTFLDEFTTNAEDIAAERIGRLVNYHPELTVTETPEHN